MILKTQLRTKLVLSPARRPIVFQNSGHTVLLQMSFQRGQYRYSILVNQQLKPISLLLSQIGKHLKPSKPKKGYPFRNQINAIRPKGIN
jgi:hypothetical protein